jgi:ABC-2 type transport system ATP-binding protein
VRLEQVEKRYGRRGPVVLRDVTLTVVPGTVTYVHGANGKGKSTLLKVLAGVMNPSRGTVVDRPKRVGYAPERFPPTVRFTPRDYLAHLARMQGSQLGKGLELLDLFGAAGFTDTPMTQLSKGSNQKVAVVQALMDDRDLLVLDESWTGLDGAAQELLTAAVEAARERGASVVVTDHGNRAVALEPDASWRVADGVVLLDALTPRSSKVVLIDLVGQGSLPDVLGSEPILGGVRLRVRSEECDTVLAAVLAAGWSVRRVGPAT